MDDVQINLKGLETLERELNNHYVVEVGILGADAVKERDDIKETNAYIGAIHEFGSVEQNIPARSFLRMPLETKLPDEIRKGSEKFIEYAAAGKLEHWFYKLGYKAEKIIDEAFETGGFGTWQPLSPITVALKGSDKILVDTAQLRSSITSEVVYEDS